MMDHTLNSIPGVRAGHWTHDSGTTGTTAVLFPQGARGGFAQPGHASGTRDLGPLDPTHLAEEVHGFCLSGGSAFGLSAADGVMAFLAAEGVGFDTGAGRVPIVPTAILFDLPVAAVRPDAAAGRAAAAAAWQATEPLASGSVGAGAGARVGKAYGNIVPGGFGNWAEAVGAWRVAAGIAVNAFGGIQGTAEGSWIAGGPQQDVPQAPLSGDWRGKNTTIGVVVTDAPLSRAQCHVLAQMACAGMARAIAPAFTPFDGDTLFVGATGQGAPPDAFLLCRLGDAAAGCVAQAIRRYSSEG